MPPFDRQLLDQTSDDGIVETVSRLAGLNAQTVRGPIVGLWTRLRELDLREVNQLLQSYQLVRANLMRATVHMVTREQYLTWRLALQPLLEQAVRQYCRGLWDLADESEVLEAGRQLLHAHDGLSRAEIGRALHPQFPRVTEPRQLGFAIRMLLPVVEKPRASCWRDEHTRYVLAEDVFTGSLATPAEGREAMLQNYVAAFGPATAADATYWSGLTGVGPDLAAVASAEGSGRSATFDLTSETAEPRPAFALPEFDNLFFCRKASDSTLYQAKLDNRLQPARMPGSLVEGGRVVGHWKHSGPSRSLQLEEWAPLSPAAVEEWDRFRTWYAEADNSQIGSS